MVCIHVGVTKNRRPQDLRKHEVEKQHIWNMLQSTPYGPLQHSNYRVFLSGGSSCTSMKHALRSILSLRIILVFYRFYPRGASSARVIVMIACLCVCVCLSYSGIVSKRLNVGSRFHDFAIFSVNFKFCRQTSAAKFHRVKTSSGNVVATSFLYLTVHRWIAGDVFIYLKFALKVTHPRRITPISTDFAL